MHEESRGNNFKIKIFIFLKKDAQVTDQMELSLLNLPLETNLYVINTDSNFDFNSIEPTTTTAAATSSSALSAGGSGESQFELNIRIMKKSYRLQFDSSIKFVDLKRKISKLATEINVNEQEWWFTSDILNDSTESLEELIESGQVLSLISRLIRTPRLTTDSLLAMPFLLMF